MVRGMVEEMLNGVSERELAQLASEVLVRNQITDSCIRQRAEKGLLSLYDCGPLRLKQRDRRKVRFRRLLSNDLLPRLALPEVNPIPFAVDKVEQRAENRSMT